MLTGLLIFLEEDCLLGSDIPAGCLYEFFDAHVCGSVDVYLSGHDRLRAWLDEPEALCGATLIVSGAGAKLRSIVERGNRTLFQDDTREGFLHATVDGDSFVGRFFDRDGLLDFEHMVVR